MPGHYSLVYKKYFVPVQNPVIIIVIVIIIIIIIYISRLSVAT
jgi:hypothetical protein